MDRDIESFLNCHSWAIVGASSQPRSFGTYAYKELKEKGLDVVGVNPKYDEVNGDKCYGSLCELPKQPDAALFLLPPWAAPAAVAEAKDAGITKIWFQRGANYDTAIEEAKKAGMTVVSGKCIMMFAAPVKGIHKFHRFLSRVTGHVMLT